MTRPYHSRQRLGCTCRYPTVHPTDIDSPEPVVDRDCPEHGDDPDARDLSGPDPDAAYDEWRDRQSDPDRDFFDRDD